MWMVTLIWPVTSEEQVAVCLTLELIITALRIEVLIAAKETLLLSLTVFVLSGHLGCPGIKKVEKSETYCAIGLKSVCFSGGGYKR